MDSCWCECCNVEGWIDHWSADFSWVWWASTTRYATTVYCTEASKCYTTKASDYNTTVYVDPSYYAEAPKNFSSPNFHYLQQNAASLLNNNVNTFLLYEGLQVLRHKGSWVLNSNLFQDVPKTIIMQCTVLLPATIPKIELVTPPKFSSTFLQPTLPQLTSRSQLTTTPRRHWSSTPRRHWYVKPRLQFTTLQPTLLKNTTLISKYYTTKALKYYTITYATTTCYTEAPKAVLLCPEFLLH
jgi:hypothetical protein